MRIDLAAVRALADAAMPGPWSTNEPGPYVHAVWSKDHPDDKVPVNPIAKLVGPADARFIAAARTLVPDLCDEIERLWRLCATHGIDPEGCDECLVASAEGRSAHA